MLQGVSVKEQRQHPRVQLNLRARIRWRGPLGSLLEVTETLDVSREGILVHRQEECREGSRVWVTFPFDPVDAGPVQPETPARVVRLRKTPAGGHFVALHFEPPRRPAQWLDEIERRRFPRASFGLPILVRALNTPWPEEAMTQDISQSGVRFEAGREYSAGQAVRVQINWGPLAKAGEVSAVVVRVESGGADDETGRGDIVGELASPLPRVAVKWESPPGNQRV